MLKKFRIISLVAIIALLSGCSKPKTIATLPTAPTVLLPSATMPLPTATPALPMAVTATSLPTLIPTATSAPNVPTATTASGSNGSSDGTLSDYLDDRSTPSGLILSLFNAINRKEYLRAYAYWEDPTHNKNTGSFDQYMQGYQDTASVKVTLGVISSGNGAGQRYYSVPAVLKAKTTGGQTQTFAGCYVAHLASPDIQTAPPFQPMSIQSADVKLVDNGADPNALLTAACPPSGGQGNPIPTTDPGTVNASNYLDDRSTAVDVLRSLFNAVNRKEYARAYFYWQAGLALPFTQFQQGYQNTAKVDVTFGDVTSDVGAGQIRYRVPVALKSQTTDGKTQFFAGCYQLHLAQPVIQAALPFLPLGIERAQIGTAASESDAENQMAGACANMP
jgi:hypothetical protein